MQAVKSGISRAEYLEIDANSVEKHEFYKGEVFAMAGGTFNHAHIAGNVYAVLRANAGHDHCHPVNSDLRVTTPSGLNTYPDVSVFCGEPELSDNQCTLHNPALLIEVLSPSTRTYDRGDKFWHYRSILSLQDYLLIDSETIHVEHHQRIDRDEWLLHEYRNPADTLAIKSVRLSLTLQELYVGVVWS